MCFNCILHINPAFCWFHALHFGALSLLKCAYIWVSFIHICEYTWSQPFLYLSGLQIFIFTDNTSMSVLVHGFLLIFSYAQVQEFLMAIPRSVFLSYSSYISSTLLTIPQTACQNGCFILPLAMYKNHFPHILSNTWYHQTLFFNSLMDENGISFQFEFPWLLRRLSILVDYVDILLCELVLVSSLPLCWAPNRHF